MKTKIIKKKKTVPKIEVGEFLRIKNDEHIYQRIADKLGMKVRGDIPKNSIYVVDILYLQEVYHVHLDKNDVVKLNLVKIENDTMIFEEV